MENTHFVACEPVGAKYEAAERLGTLQIVRPSWIEACWEQQQLVDCGKHFLREPEDSNVGARTNQAHLSLQEILNKELDGTNTIDSWLFSACRFCLVGFNEDDVLFSMLTRLIRRCMGTIYWENCDQDAITHAIVRNDYMDEATRYVRWVYGMFLG
jgi:hypothetical protein